jgi:carboxymethylenebutenolidase
LRIAAAFAAILLFVAGCAEPAQPETALTGRVVAYGTGPTGAELRGILYLPAGEGPFPVLLYAHGSAPGALSNEAFEAIAPVFTARGWAMFAPYRRGQGLSRGAGPFLGDEIRSARAGGGGEAAQARLAELLAADHMADQARAFAWLAGQPFADRRRIATMGNSFGGVIALLSAARLPVCAAVDSSGGADSWADAPALRALMTDAAVRARAPVFFLQAANDHDLAPSRTLYDAMRRAGRPAALRIYPAFGSSARDGHAFAYRGVALWSGDVLGFLGRACSISSR